MLMTHLRGQRLHAPDAGELIPAIRLECPQVVRGLQVQPEQRARAEGPGEPQRRVSSDRPLAEHDFIDPAGWYFHGVGQTRLRQLQRLEEMGGISPG